MHNGGEAADTYRLVTSDKKDIDREKLHKDMEEYCKLDTFAMVKLWQELVRVVKDF